MMVFIGVGFDRVYLRVVGSYAQGGSGNGIQ